MDRLFISSVNLDELIESPLPSAEDQFEHMMGWLSASLKDDAMGRITITSLENLASLFGAVDGTRVKRLLASAKDGGLIEFQNSQVGLTLKGWERIQKRKADVPHPDKVTTTPSRSKAHCNRCGGERNVLVRASHTVHGSEDVVSWSDTFEVLECAGCNDLFVRQRYWFSEWDNFDDDPITGQPRIIPGIRESYWPPVTKRTKPRWVDNIEDQVLRDVINEVYTALDAGLIVLAAIGVRTLLDRTMFLRLGDATEGFAPRLKEMVARGNISSDEQQILVAVTDAGSAAAHRGFSPSTELMEHIISSAENYLQREFVLRHAATQVTKATPKRNKTAKNTSGKTGN